MSEAIRMGSWFAIVVLGGASVLVWVAHRLVALAEALVRAAWRFMRRV